MKYIFCSFVPAKEPKPRAGIIFVTRFMPNGEKSLYPPIVGKNFSALLRIAGTPQKSLMARENITMANGSSWEEIFTMGLLVFLCSGG